MPAETRWSMQPTPTKSPHSHGKRRLDYLILPSCNELLHAAVYITNSTEPEVRQVLEKLHVVEGCMFKSVFASRHALVAVCLVAVASFFSTAPARATVGGPQCFSFGSVDELQYYPAANAYRIQGHAAANSSLTYTFVFNNRRPWTEPLADLIRQKLVLQAVAQPNAPRLEICGQFVVPNQGQNITVATQMVNLVSARLTNLQ
jgi:hypothetical protein